MHGLSYNGRPDAAGYIVSECFLCLSVRVNILSWVGRQDAAGYPAGYVVSMLRNQRAD